MYCKQQGAVLLAIVCGVVLVTGVGLLGSLVVNDVMLRNQQQQSVALARAKDALISYAVSYTDNYGHNTRGGVGRLPCPATDVHSSPARSCKKNALGFLPSVWKRDGKWIDIDYQEYFHNQNLWYAVSADFRYNPAFNKLNPQTHGNYFTLNERDEVIAVVISPGAMQEGQQRDPRLVKPSDYLEAENADLDAIFKAGSTISDQMLPITRDDLMPLVERRVLGVVQDWLNEYRQEYGHFPYAARLGDPTAACVEGLASGIPSMTRGNCSIPALGELKSEYIAKNRTVHETWFGQYDWPLFIYHQIDQNCLPLADASSCDGIEDPLFALTVDNEPAKVLLVSVGQPIVSEHLGAMQDRLSLPSDKASYLDTAELVDAIDSFKLVNRNGSRNSDDILAINDQYLVIR